MWLGITGGVATLGWGLSRWADELDCKGVALAKEARGRREQAEKDERAEQVPADIGKAKQQRASEREAVSHDERSAERSEHERRVVSTDEDVVVEPAGGTRQTDRQLWELPRPEPMPIPAQQAAVEKFLHGLVTGFGIKATVSSELHGDVIVGSIDGDSLGLLIGPEGDTTYAIQELGEKALDRQGEGRDTARMMVDVAGYSERRRAALSDFARRQADRVVVDGVAVPLEPMNPADRKAVHEAIIEVDGVESLSEGEEPERWVVLLPESGGKSGHLRSGGNRDRLPAGLRYEVLKRDGNQCLACGAAPEAGAELHVDHVVPVSKGGTDGTENLQTLCQDCNLGKGNRDDTDFRETP